MHIRQCYKCEWGMFMNVKEEMLAGIADADARYSDADPVVT